MSDDTRSSAMPDEFDRLLGSLHGLPDSYHAKPTIIQAVPPLGVGGTRKFIVQTIRQYHKKPNRKGEEITYAQDTLFMEIVTGSGTVRVVVPNDVLDAMVRQRDRLTKARAKQQAKRVATERKERGERPSFMKKVG